MEVLVARIALYPDELIAVITGASLYPLQIVEAARYLDKYAKDKTLKPKENWDGSRCVAAQLSGRRQDDE